MYRYFKNIVVSSHFISESKGLSEESINPPTTYDDSPAPSLNYIGTKARVKFDGSYLKQDKNTFTHRKTVNICIVYEINFWDCGYDDYSTLENSLFGAVN